MNKNALFLLFVILLCPSVHGFAGGDGSSGNPYQISDCTELEAIETDLDADYIIINDIDCSSHGSFTIGGQFIGTLNGNFSTIKDITSNKGLFTYIYINGVVENLTLENVDVDSTGNSIGGLAGLCTGATIKYIRVNGTVDSSGNYVGGIIGQKDSGCNLYFSMSDVDVSGGPYHTGGIAGYNKGTIQNSYSFGDTTGTESVGGITGYNVNTVSRCYATGTPSGDSEVGGVVGYESTYGSTSNSFWDTQTSGVGSSDGGTGKTTAQMKNVATFTDTATSGLSSPWDFATDPNDDSATNDYWYINASVNNGYPYLVNFFPNSVIPYTPLWVNWNWNDINSTTYFTHTKICLYSNKDMNCTLHFNGTTYQNSSISMTPCWNLDLNRQTYTNVYATCEDSDEVLVNSSKAWVISQYFMDGSGTSGDPYQIKNCTSLQNMNNDLDAYYELINDINCSDTINWNGGNGFNPVGTYSGWPIDTGFEGNLNGNGYNIDGLYVNKATSGSGLFEATNGAVVRNLTFTNIDINGAGYTGSLTGPASSSNFYYISTSGEVSGSSYVGGIVGHGSGVIYYSASNVTVTCSADHCGGFVGFSQFSVANSYSLKPVSASRYVGGIVGRNYDGGSVYNCYTTSTISGGQYIGALIGDQDGGYWGNSYYNSETSGGAAGYGTARTTAQMKNVATFTNTGSPWDFIDNPYNDVANNDYWNIDPTINDGYPFIANFYLNSFSPPRLTWNWADLNSTIDIDNTKICVSSNEDVNCTLNFNGTIIANSTTGTNICWYKDDLNSGNYSTVYATCEDSDTNISNTSFAYLNVQSFKGGDGTEGNPYQIHTCDALQAIDDNLNSFFEVVNNIDCSETVSWNGGAGFDPIGSGGSYFTGVLNGSYYNITNLTINRPGSNYQALFVLTNTVPPTVSLFGLRLIDISVTGNQYVGTISSFNSGIIADCYASGTVTATSSYAGGIIGQSYSDIQNCEFEGTVEGNNYIGGISGQKHGGDLINCRTNATLSGSLLVGGIVGENTQGDILGSFSNSRISGSRYLGGIVGRMDNTITTYVRNCSAYVTINSASAEDVGGIVGYSRDHSIVTDCNSSGYINADTSVGGLVGRAQADIFNSTSKVNLNTNSGSMVGGLLGTANSGSYYISNSYSEGNITGNGDYIGGFIGLVQGGNILNSYSLGNIECNNYCGGFAGSQSGGLINNTYSIGLVTGTSNEGGFLGYTSGGTCVNSFWDNQTSGMSSSSCGTGKFTNEIKNINTFTDTTTLGLTTAWDFVGNVNDDSSNNNYWNIRPEINGGYPFLTLFFTVTFSPPSLTWNWADINSTIQINNTKICIDSDENVNCTLNFNGTKTRNTSTSTTICWNRTGLSEGFYDSISAVCEDLDGNTSQIYDAWLNFSLPPPPPYIPINISWSWDDINSTITVNNTKICIDSNKDVNCSLDFDGEKTLNSSTGTSICWYKTMLDNGFYDPVSVTCQDDVDNTSQIYAAWINVSVDYSQPTPLPALTWDWDDINSTIIINNTKVCISSDQDVNCTLFFNSNSYANSTTSTNICWNITGLDHRIYEKINATCENFEQNTSSIKGAWVNVSTLRSAPYIPISISWDWDDVNSTITENNTKICVSSNKDVNCSLDFDGEKNLNSTTGDSICWHKTLLDNGYYDPVSVTCEDEIGNTSQLLNSWVNVSVDYTRPILAPVLTWNWADINSTIDIDSTKICISSDQYVNCTLDFNGTKTSNSTNYTTNCWNQSSLEEVTYNSITATCENAHGNLSNTYTAYLIVDLPDPIPVTPVIVNLTSPSDLEVLDNENFSFQYSVNLNSDCSLYWNETGVWEEDSVEEDASGSVTIDKEMIENGGYIWNVLCIDTTNSSNFGWGSSHNYSFLMNFTPYVPPKKVIKNFIVKPPKYDDGQSFKIKNTKIEIDDADIVFDENNKSQPLNQTMVIKIKNDTRDYIVFTYNFSKGNLSLENLTINYSTSNNSAALEIRGMPRITLKKTITIDDLNPNITSYCIKDDDARLLQISNDCNSTREQLVFCDGEQYGNYTCNTVNNISTITGLLHSVVLEMDGCTDHDGDSFGAGCSAGPDCDDTSASIYRGAPCTRSGYKNSRYNKDCVCSGGDEVISHGGNSGGGGGGGGTSASSPSESLGDIESVMFSSIEKGDGRTVFLSKKDIRFTKVYFKVAETIFNVNFKVAEVLKLPDSVKAPPINSYHLVKIMHENLNDSALDNGAEIEFIVEKEWLLENILERNEVSLYRYNDEKWQELDTEIIKVSNDYVYYKAKTPGFSYFSIGEKTGIDETETEKEKTESKQNENKKTSFSKAKSTENPQQIAIEEEPEENKKLINFDFLKDVNYGRLWRYTLVIMITASILFLGFEIYNNKHWLFK